MSDTSGFYKQDGNTLLHAPNYVYAPGFTLARETHAAEIYPVDGWTWFDSATDAYAAAGIPLVTDPEASIDDLTVALLQGL